MKTVKNTLPTGAVRTPPAPPCLTFKSSPLWNCNHISHHSLHYLHKYTQSYDTTQLVHTREKESISEKDSCVYNLPVWGHEILKKDNLSNIFNRVGKRCISKVSKRIGLIMSANRHHCEDFACGFTGQSYICWKFKGEPMFISKI